MRLLILRIRHDIFGIFPEILNCYEPARRSLALRNWVGGWVCINCVGAFFAQLWFSLIVGRARPGIIARHDCAILGVQLNELGGTPITYTKHAWPFFIACAWSFALILTNFWKNFRQMIGKFIWIANLVIVVNIHSLVDFLIVKWLLL